MQPRGIDWFRDTHGKAGRAIDSSELAAVLDEFTRTVTEDFSLDDILSQLAAGVMRVFDVTGAGVSAPGPDGRLLHTVYATSSVVAELERVQEDTQHGPCVDCHASGRVINLADVEREGSWPTYQRQAHVLGIRAVAAIPLWARGRSWGVLDVYRSDPDPLNEAELAAIAMLANLATSYLVVTDDRDVARRATDMLTERATRDELTGLLVRWVFLEHLERALARLHRLSAPVAVLFIDLDGLKYVNDTYGHATGDELIMTMVSRIQASLRPEDLLARIGGDEFVVLLTDLDTARDAWSVAERITDTLALPYRPEGETMTPTASIGIAQTSDPSTGPAALIAHADSAMYEAKRSHPGAIREFDPAAFAHNRDTASTQRLNVEELRAALAADEFEVAYQPIDSLTDQQHRSIFAVEALARWRHPRRGMIPASLFIPEAESCGLLPDIGRQVLSKACQQMAGWRSALAASAPSRLFVNLSVTELREPTLYEFMVRTLANSRLPPECLTIEITETGFMSRHDEMASTLEALQRLGCELAIDDFGTGYSSLSRLIDIPASTIKIDRSFTNDLGADPNAAAVVAAVQTLGASLHRRVIAEGIESAHILDHARSLGIAYGQGYHLAEPMTGARITETLSAGD